MNKKGDKFSEFHSNIKFVMYLRETKMNAILSLWECKKHKYGFYFFSGLQPITDRLFNSLKNNKELIWKN